VLIWCFKTVFAAKNAESNQKMQLIAQKKKKAKKLRMLSLWGAAAMLCHLPDIACTCSNPSLASRVGELVLCCSTRSSLDLC